MAKKTNTTPVVEQKEKVEVAAATTKTTQEVTNVESTEVTETVADMQATEAPTETTEVVADVEAPETTTEDVAKPDVVDFSAEAEELMRAQYIKEIWRCPVNGYWFTKSDLASEHGKKVGKKPEYYTL